MIVNMEDIWRSGLSDSNWFVWTMLILMAFVAVLSAVSVSRRKPPNTRDTRDASTKGLNLQHTHGLRLTSSAFEDGGDIPVRYTGEGEDRSPPLEWSQIPEGTREFAVLCEDPEGDQAQSFTHWLAYNISPNVTSLPEGIMTSGRLELPVRIDQGMNSFGGMGYGGPSPKQGSGRAFYRFTIYALDRELALEPGASKREFLRAINSHVISKGRLTGSFVRGLFQKTA